MLFTEGVGKLSWIERPENIREGHRFESDMLIKRIVKNSSSYSLLDQINVSKVSQL